MQTMKACFRVKQLQTGILTTHLRGHAICGSQARQYASTHIVKDALPCQIFLLTTELIHQIGFA